MSQSPRSSKHSVSKAHQPSQKRHTFQQDTIIRDSDEEEVILEEIRTSFSPQLKVKRSPIVNDTSKSPRWENGPAFELAGNRGKATAEPKSRVGSPLRPISRNVGGKQDNVPLPLQKVSRTPRFGYH